VNRFILAALLIQGLLRPQADQGVITGEVRSLNGAPAAGVRVAALEAPPAGEPITSVSIMASLAQTDSNGRYRLEGIPPGRYYIVAGAVDFPTFFPGVPSPARATALTVTRGATLAGVDFPLAAAGPFAVSGRVIDRDANSYVSLTGPEQLVGEIVANGQFVFPRVRPGAYTLRLIVGDSPLAGTNVLRTLTMLPVVGLTTAGLVVSSMPIIVDDRDITGLEITGSSVRLTGRADVEDGGPLVSLDLALAGISAAALSQDVRVNLDGNGVFTTVLPVGEYRVLARPSPDIYRVDSFTSGAVDLLKEPLKISKGASTSLAVKLAVAQPPLWVKVSGRVTGMEYLPPDHGPRVVLSGGAVPSYYEATISADGSYTLPRVLRGTYTVTAPGSEYVRSQTVVLEGSNIEPILVEVPIQRHFTGRIVVEGGEQVPRLLISFTSVKWGRNARVPVEPPGTFSITLPEGESLVRPFEPTRADYEIKGVTSGSTNLLSAPLLVGRTDPQEILVTVALGRSVRVAGRVVGGQALPAEARVKLGGDAFLDLEAPVRQDGAFEFPRILPGTYILEVVAGGVRASSQTIVVSDRDLTSIELKIGV
jgi:hypothetical protein